LRTVIVLARRAVVLRARFVHVGDRRKADFQALAGEVELLLQRGFRASAAASVSTCTSTLKYGGRRCA
jgi:hypothetical protein